MLAAGLKLFVFRNSDQGLMYCRVNCINSKGEGIFWNFVKAEKSNCGFGSILGTFMSPDTSTLTSSMMWLFNSVIVFCVWSWDAVAYFGCCSWCHFNKRHVRTLFMLANFVSFLTINLYNSLNNWKYTIKSFLLIHTLIHFFLYFVVIVNIFTNLYTSISK